MGKLLQFSRACKKRPSFSLTKPPPKPSLSPSSAMDAPLQFPQPKDPMDKHISVCKKTQKEESKTQLTATQIFKSPNLSDAKRVYDFLLPRCDNPLDPNFNNSLLADFSRFSSFETALHLFNYMKMKSRFAPDRRTFNILLSQSCQTGEIAAIRDALNMMTFSGFHPDHAACDIAVRGLCSINDYENAVDLFKEFSCKSSALPDSFTYNFLIRKLCKVWDTSSVCSFIEEMRELGLQPDVVTYTIMIDTVCKSGNLRLAMRLLDALDNSGFKPDCYLYNTIIKGHCFMDKGYEALSVYKRMKEKGVKPDIVTYNTLIFGLAKSGRVDQARKYMCVMIDEGLKPDTITYTALMNGLCRKGDVISALRMLKDMEKDGCVPNACTYNTLLQGLAKGRRLESALKVFEIMNTRSFELEAASYATFVRALCRGNKVAEAYDVFDYALSSKSLTEVAAYAALEDALKSAKNFKSHWKT